MLVFLDKDLYANRPSQEIRTAIAEADILFAVEVTSPAGVSHVGPLMDQSETSLSLGPSQDLLTRSRLGGIAVGQLSGVQKAVADLGLWKQAADGMKVSLFGTVIWKVCATTVEFHNRSVRCYRPSMHIRSVITESGKKERNWDKEYS